MPDAKVHAAAADLVLAALYGELLSWREAGREACHNPSADPNSALVTGGCRFFGRRAHPSAGGAVRVRDDPKLAKYLAMLAMPRVPRDAVARKMAEDGVVDTLGDAHK